MKKSLICLLALLVSVHAENLFSNGAMDSAGGWKGTKKMVEEPKDEKSLEKPNRCLMLTAKKSDPVSFNQEADTKGLFGVNLRFRYRTKDYQGLGLELRGVRQDGSFTYTNRPLEADGQWHEVSWAFNQVVGSKKIDFTFRLLQGMGDVYFDDISAEAAK